MMVSFLSNNQKMKTILVLTDFSIRADHAAHYALKLAQKIKANLLICNVFLAPADEPMTAQIAWPIGNYETFEDDSMNDVSELAGRLNQQLDKNLTDGEFRPSIETASIAGSVTDTLNNIVASNHILLAVISTHGANGLGSFLLGNHARDIIEDANCPVLLIPYQAMFDGYKKIAFATSLTGSDINVLHSLSGFAKYLNAEILITHVADEKFVDPGDFNTAKSFLEMVSSKIDYPSIFYRLIKGKNVNTGLEWLSQQIDIDLLVLVHRKRSFFQRIFEGSITQKLAEHLTKPMLVFPFSKVQVTLPVF
jgi:nucleotide-binding universal stress UspA family protein